MSLTTPLSTVAPSPRSLWTITRLHVTHHHRHLSLFCLALFGSEKNLLSLSGSKTYVLSNITTTRKVPHSFVVHFCFVRSPRVPCPLFFPGVWRLTTFWLFWSPCSSSSCCVSTWKLEPAFNRYYCRCRLLYLHDDVVGWRQLVDGLVLMFWSIKTSL